MTFETTLELSFYGRLVDYVGSGSTIESFVKSVPPHDIAQAEKCKPGLLG
jgi:hypothetical protein